MSIRKIAVMILAALVSGVTVGFGVPAKPGVVTVQQSDGTTIDIERHGDEFFRYTTTSDGYLISQHEGLYYYSDISMNGEITRSQTRASSPARRGAEERRVVATRSSARNTAELSVAANALSRARRREVAEAQMQVSSTSSSSSQQSTTRATGDVRGLVIMVSFADNDFTYDNSDFYSMLNDENYSENSGPGSARDFFYDNSMGTFNPSFDVVGPYKLSENMSYYGGNDSSGSDSNPRLMVSEACKLADDDGADYSLYDSNSDGYVDMVFIFYAGYNEAEGADEDTIWPHMWSTASSSLSAPEYDGKKVWLYACTSELSGSGYSSTPFRDPTAEMAGIGTFTHEYGHTLGLYDTYDTDYDTNGYSSGLYTFDIMSRGSYNNSGRTPPYYGAIHRYQLGWITPTIISAIDNYELPSISTNEAYIVNTEVEDEYYLFEYRNGAVNGMREWDGYITYSASGSDSNVNGLFITHIDRSTNSAAGGYTAAQLWANNAPNAYLSHECARVVFSNASTTAVSSYSTFLSMFFPGIVDNTSFGATTSPAAVSWGGVPLPIELTNIRVEDGVLKFTNYESLLNSSGEEDESDEGDESDEEDETDEVEDDTNDESSDDSTTNGDNSGVVYGDGYPFIVLNLKTFSDDCYTIVPTARNVSGYDSVEWWLNGVIINEGTTQILSSGSYTLVVQLFDGDNEERIIKSFEL